MKKNTRTLLTLALLLVFLASTAMVLRQFRDKSRGEEAYGEALALASGTEAQQPTPAAAAENEPPSTEETAEAATEPPRTVWVPAPVEDDPVMEEMASIDLAALQEVNEDVLGWIRIPDTRIDYPLLQGEDNEYYLNHTWDHQQYDVGSIFLECMNSPELTDYNTIIYGHNMNNGSMFAGLHMYTTETYRQEHPYVYILTDAGVYRYEIFAAYKADVVSITYGLSFNQQSTMEKFLSHAQESSKIDTGIIPEMQDRILTLSTCSGGDYSTRWVVQARMQMVEAEI